jgi:hypothetical protein
MASSNGIPSIVPNDVWFGCAVVFYRKAVGAPPSVGVMTFGVRADDLNTARKKAEACGERMAADVRRDYPKADILSVRSFVNDRSGEACVLDNPDELTLNKTDLE